MRIKAAMKHIIIVSFFLLNACVSSSSNSQHTKALALASENGPALLFIAGLPLQYYCEHSVWPITPVLAAGSKPFLSGVRRLRFYTEELNYVATFQLHSFVAEDNFSVNWQMIIPPPMPGRGEQIVPLLIVAKQFNIAVSFDYEYACFPEEKK